MENENYLQRILHPEQDSLSIRFLDLPKESITNLIYKTGPSIKDRGPYIRTNNGKKILKGTKEFDQEIEKLAKSISSNKKELLDFFKKAIQIRKEFP